MIRKILISTVVGLATFFTLFNPFNFTGTREVEFKMIALVIGILVFIIGMNEVKRGQSGIDLKLANFYAVAEEEYDGGIIVKGLWSQALVKAKGDE